MKNTAIDTDGSVIASVNAAAAGASNSSVSFAKETEQHFANRRGSVASMRSDRSSGTSVSNADYRKSLKKGTLMNFVTHFEI